MKGSTPANFEPSAELYELACLGGRVAVLATALCGMSLAVYSLHLPVTNAMSGIVRGMAWYDRCAPASPLLQCAVPFALFAASSLLLAWVLN